MQSLTGKTFGSYVVGESVKKDHHNMYLCTCLCGKQSYIRPSDLLSGTKYRCRSCHLRARRKDLTGKTFGSWSVLKFDSETGLYLCECVCKKQSYVAGTELRSGRNRRCLACGKERLSKPTDVVQILFKDIKHRRKLRPVSLSVEFLRELLDKQHHRCALSGVEIRLAKTSKGHYKNRETTASIDRIDSRKGYTQDNVQWIHKDLQWMKNDQKEKDFFSWCSIISKHKGANMTSGEIYAKVIDSAMSKLPEQNAGALECQIALKSGMTVAGALLRHPDVPGAFYMRTLLRKGDPKAGPVEQVDVVLTAEDIASMAIPVARSEQSGLVTPDGSPVLPRPRMS